MGGVGAGVTAASSAAADVRKGGVTAADVEPLRQHNTVDVVAVAACVPAEAPAVVPRPLPRADASGASVGMATSICSAALQIMSRWDVSTATRKDPEAIASGSVGR